MSVQLKAGVSALGAKQNIRVVPPKEGTGLFERMLCSRAHITYLFSQNHEKETKHIPIVYTGMLLQLHLLLMFTSLGQLSDSACFPPAVSLRRISLTTERATCQELEYIFRKTLPGSADGSIAIWPCSWLHFSVEYSLGPSQGQAADKLPTLLDPLDWLFLGLSFNYRRPSW